MRHIFEMDGVEHCMWLSRSAGGGFTLDTGGEQLPVALNDDGLRVDGLAVPVYVARSGDRLFVHVGGDAHELLFREAISYHAAAGGGASEDVLRAPMPGAVVAVPVVEGQAVSEGNILMVIESMKLETAIRAPRDGVIKTVHVTLAKGFERDAPLVSLVPLEVRP